MTFLLTFGDTRLSGSGVSLVLLDWTKSQVFFSYMTHVRAFESFFKCMLLQFKDNRLQLSTEDNAKLVITFVKLI